MQQGMLIERALDKITPKIIGKVNSAVHGKIIQEAFKPFGVKVKISKDDLVATDMIVVTGQISQWKVRQSIEVFLNYNPKTLRIELTESIWKQLRFELSQVLQHELIHRRQCSYMNTPSEEWIDHNCKVYASKAVLPKKREAQEYLGSTDEIEAHAHCIMMDFKHYFPRTDPIKLLKQARKIPRSKSYTLKDYFVAFDGNMNHPAMKRLFKKVVYWIENPEA